MTSLLIHAVVAVISIAPHNRLSRTRSVLAALAQTYATERWITADGLRPEDVAEAPNTAPHTGMLISRIDT
ncbi:hypothetical protein MLGJGCBP_01126 [Rhodococcus sp. T7]|nr:hypothetical protein MLGJGCBP_10131 [Rhodococcus sp. T7]KAF0965700.1 hypothetical protein MLGJGCBP_01126 [Rhodococcus sp. T7]